ncbi:MAG TPA: hypothetical protein VG297_22345 [Bryobacteraceae bacterium]|jgi:hypothetical protein|nr:hypothetical protein [Bryobacteraceae bacterium]
MRALCVLLTIPMLGGAVVIDRIAVAVNRHAIKTSDIEQDVRLTDFLNKANLTIDTAAKKAAEERLIDQQIIRQELSSGGYGRASDADAEALLRQIQHDRFGGAEARLRASLEQYGLTEDELRQRLLWQLTVLRFINERFRTGVLVSDDDVQKYYEQHRSSFRQPLDQASASIRSALEGNQVTQQFETWLGDERKRMQIDYKAGAIQ